MSWAAWDKSKGMLPIQVSAFEAPCEACGAVFTTIRQTRRFCNVTCQSAEWRRLHLGQPSPGRPAAKHVSPEFDYPASAFE